MTNETDSKYAVSQRKHICPSFNELRHILNLSQVISIGQNLSLISFDGDQTLYSDGGNFENNMELAFLIICLLKARVKVAIITAAGYGYDGSKYSIRLQGLLDSFIAHELGFEETAQFYVYGGF
jgi:IMP and pyridine-specific 5'-nucleotidase